MFHGIVYPWRALRLFQQTPSLWGYVAIPIGITFLLAALVYGTLLPPAWEILGQGFEHLSQQLSRQWLAHLPDPWSGLEGLLQSLLFILRGGVIVLFFLILGLVIAQLSVVLGSPWYGQLSESLERRVLPHRPLPPSIPIWQELSRSVQFELKKLALTVLVLIVVILLQFLPVAGQLFGTLLATLWGALLACLDFWDGPLERRRLRFRQKLAWIMGQFPANFSFGIVASIMVSLPVVNLLTIPLCVAAGTLLVCDRLKV